MVLCYSSLDRLRHLKNTFLTISRLLSNQVIGCLAKLTHKINHLGYLTSFVTWASVMIPAHKVIARVRQGAHMSLLHTVFGTW